MDEKSLAITLTSGEEVELQPYFDLMDNDDSRDVFELLQSIQCQTALALDNAAKSNTIEIYDTYIIEQDEHFWKLTPTQFVAMCKEGAKIGNHTLPNTTKMLKSPPKGVEGVGYDFFAADKNIKVCSPLKWREEDYKEKLNGIRHLPLNEFFDLANYQPHTNTINAIGTNQHKKAQRVVELLFFNHP